MESNKKQTGSTHPLANIRSVHGADSVKHEQPSEIDWMIDQIDIDQIDIEQIKKNEQKLK